MKYTLVLFLALPLVAHAAEPVGAYAKFVNKIIDIINILIPFIIGLTFFMFIFGIFRYVGQGASEEGRSKGKELIIYGIIGVFIMLSFWGLATILHNTVFGNTL